MRFKPETRAKVKKLLRLKKEKKRHSILTSTHKESLHTEAKKREFKPRTAWTEVFSPEAWKKYQQTKSDRKLMTRLRKALRHE